jgi:hypothetical protein
VWDEGGQGHSVFARAFLTGLAEIGEAAFSASDIYHRYINQQVAGRSLQMPQYEAIQDSGHDGGDFVFIRKADHRPGD